jgi:hypothetical protein
MKKKRFTSWLKVFQVTAWKIKRTPLFAGGRFEDRYIISFEDFSVESGDWVGGKRHPQSHKIPCRTSAFHPSIHLIYRTPALTGRIYRSSAPYKIKFTLNKVSGT